MSYYFRKRKKDLIKDTGPDIQPELKDKSTFKSKVKDSDDEDYMAWKKPNATAPIVTFTPPPDDRVPRSSFRYKPNILTKKYLEIFNVRQNENKPMFADGDDGFESLNGYNSNGSDGESRNKELASQSKSSTNTPKTKSASDIQQPKLEPISKVFLENSEDISVGKVQCENVSTSGKDIKDDEEKSIDPDSDSAVTTTNPSVMKRAGVRFRNSWAKDAIQPETSDEDYATVKGNQKVSHNYFQYLIHTYGNVKRNSTTHLSNNFLYNSK